MTKGPSRSADIPTPYYSPPNTNSRLLEGDGRGRWMVKYKDEAIDRWKGKRLCGPDCTLSEIWQAVRGLKRRISGYLCNGVAGVQTTPIWRKTGYLYPTGLPRLPQ